MDLTPGTWVQVEALASPAQILAVDTLWSRTRVHLRPAGGSPTLVMSPEALTPLPAYVSPEGAADAVRRIALLGKILEVRQGEALLAPVASAVLPLPHQLRALKRLMATPERIRYLLADEVGLGKTIEAGLALRELRLRGWVNRVLLVVPKGLIPQWLAELQDRFGETFVHLEPSALPERLSEEEPNPWSRHDRVICSLDSLKPLTTRRGWSPERVAAYNRKRVLDLAEAGWDLIIFDEAHRVAGSSDTVARHELARLLADSAPSFLLLSATPHQGKTDAFHRLLALLDRENFPDEASVSRDRVAPYVVRTEKRRTIDHLGRPLFQPRVTKLVEVPWEGHALQRELYDHATAFVRAGHRRAENEKNAPLGFLMLLLQRLVSSSPRAFAATLERRLQDAQAPEEAAGLATELTSWNELDGQEQLDRLSAGHQAARGAEAVECRTLLELAKRVERAGPDAKTAALLDLLRRLQLEESDPNLKVLIFTEFVATQTMLAEQLRSRGVSTVCLNGSLSLEDRKTVQKCFAQDSRVLISTDAGGEGLNLQFCHVVVNFDLGWRPMALEQRIGRVDRIGQKNTVKVFNFLLQDSVETRIREVLESKLEVILQEFGVDKTSDLLDSAEGAALFDKLFEEALLHPERLAGEADRVASDLRLAAQNREAHRLPEEAEPPTLAGSGVCTEPLGSWFAWLLEHETRLAGGSWCRLEDGAVEMIPEPGSPVQRLVFPAQDIRPEGDLIHLDHPRLRTLLASLKPVADDAPPFAFSAPELPEGTSGLWSLWRLRTTSFGFPITRVFPVFVSDKGLSFPRTAHHIWSNLLSLRLDPCPAPEPALSGKLLSTSRRLADEDGASLWQQVENRHAQRSHFDENKITRYFASQRRLTSELGLPEVRAFRLRALQAQENRRRLSHARSSGLLPELEPLLFVHFRSSV